MSGTQNTIWVLTQGFAYEGEALFGVYTTEADAERASRVQGRLDADGAVWCVYAVELDAPARWYGYNDRQENKGDD